MSNQNDYFNNLFAQQSGLAQYHPSYQNQFAPSVGALKPAPEAEPEFNLVLLTGDDDEA